MADTHAALYVHLAWGTWQRLPLLHGETERHVHRLIGSKCKTLGVGMVAIGGVEDHIHVLVGVPTTLSVALLAKYLKGFSSRVMNAQLSTSPTQFFKWQDGYGAVSVSPSALDEVARYIAHQREHHRDKALVEAWEPPNDEPATRRASGA